MIEGSSLWSRYLRSEWQAIHSIYLAYPQRNIITSIVYWQALLMHNPQIIVSQKQ